MRSVLRAHLAHRERLEWDQLTIVTVAELHEHAAVIEGCPSDTEVDCQPPPCNALDSVAQGQDAGSP